MLIPFLGVVASFFAGMAIVHLMIPLVAASILFAPVAGWAYERTVTATDARTDRWALRRSGMIAGALFIIPWWCMMKGARGDVHAMPLWETWQRRIYYLWLVGPVLLFASGSVLFLTMLYIERWDLERVGFQSFWWAYTSFGIAAVGCILSFIKDVRARRKAQWEGTLQPTALRPFLLTFLWTLVAIGHTVAIVISQQGGYGELVP